MPGIVGIVDTVPRMGLDGLAASMCQAIKHQDWHTVHTWADPVQGVALGRVSTGILNPEPQPIFNEDRSLAIVMEGELFDYRAEKDGLARKGHRFTLDNDPEFLLHLYEELGEGFAEGLNGFFVALIWDKRRRRLTIANDRCGFRALYCAQVGGRLLLCSEVKGILCDGAFQRFINYQGVADFFAFGHLLGDKTFLKGIYLLPPASVWHFHDGELVKKRYWLLDQHLEVDTRPEPEYLEEAAILFRQAVARQTQGHHNLAISLTGGLDSRAVMAAIDHTSPRVHSFVHGIKGCTDAVLAQTVADKTTRERHHFYELGADFLARFPEYVHQTVFMGDGMSKMVGLSQVLHSRRQVREFAQIELNASGADITRGWGLKPLILSAKSQAELVQACFDSYTMGVDEARLFGNDFRSKVQGQALHSLERVLSQARNGLSPGQAANYFYLAEHVRRLFMNGWGLVANYIEYRPPYYDNDYLDLLLKAPLRLLNNEERKIPKYTIERWKPELARIPMEDNELAVPFYESRLHRKACRYPRELLEAYSRRYLGPFTPRLSRIFCCSRPYQDYDGWFHGELRPWVEGILLDPKTLGRGVYNPESVRETVSRHMGRKADLSVTLGLMIGFELWLRLFMD